MHGFATMDLSLAGAQSSEESLQCVVGAVTLGPSIASEQSRLTPLAGCRSLPKGVAEMSDHRRILRMASGVLFQLSQEFFDAALDCAGRGGWLPVCFGRIEASLQCHQPTPLTLELPIANGEGQAALHHGQQLIQEWMPPFLRLRSSEASKRAKSSNTRKPPSAKGGLLPSVRVVRIRSA